MLFEEDNVLCYVTALPKIVPTTFSENGKYGNRYI